MRKSRRNYLNLAVSLTCLGLLIYFILNFAPDKNFSILKLSLPTLPVFFLLFFAAIYEALAYFLNNKRQGFFISLFTTIYLILRFFKLTHPFFLILILALFVTFELLFRKRN